VTFTSHRIELELGTWTHSEWRPEECIPLSWVVERIWDFDGRLSSRRERVFPTGVVELIVQLDERYGDVDADSVRLTPATCITGIQTGPMVVEAPPGRCRVLGVRFHPPGAWAVFGLSLSDLTNLTTDLCDVSGAVAGELAERCSDAGDSESRVRAAIQWLCEMLTRLTPALQPDPVVHRVAMRIAGAAGAVRIDALRAECGIDTRRLATLFRQQVGVTPKRFARIHRFRRALELLHGVPLPMAQIAFAAGYYDQSHMVNELNELSGLTPGQLRAAPRYPESVNTAEG